MSDVGDVHLEVPATVGAALDVNGVVEIACGFAVDGYDRQVAKIFAACMLGFTHRFCAVLRLFQNFRREGMREVMFPNDDFGIDAEVSRTPQYFDDAARGRCATPRIAN